MSKFIEFIKKIKSDNEDSICIFKVGSFLNVYGEDALILNGKCNLKLNCASTGICKCGFPDTENALKKYMRLLMNSELKIKIFACKDILRDDEITDNVEYYKYKTRCYYEIISLNYSDTDNTVELKKRMVKLIKCDDCENNVYNSGISKTNHLESMIYE